MATLKKTWRFIEQQRGGWFNWTYEKSGAGWRARRKTAAERAESQLVYGALVKAHKDSLPTR